MPCSSAPRAFGDESFQENPEGSGHYILAAAIVDPRRAEEDRTALRSLLRPRSARKLHWRDLTAEDKLGAVEGVAALGATHLVAVGAPLTPRQQERARRKCLLELLYHLEAWGVGHLSLERRTASLDKKDIDTVTACRTGARSERSVYVDHILPSQEPLVWMADIVAGACAKARCGDGRYVKALEESVLEFTVAL